MVDFLLLGVFGHCAWKFFIALECQHCRVNSVNLSARGFSGLCVIAMEDRLFKEKYCIPTIDIIGVFQLGGGAGGGGGGGAGRGGAGRATRTTSQGT